MLGFFFRRLSASFWFVPTVMVVAAVALAFAMNWLDASAWAGEFHLWSDRLSLGAEGSRQLVATVAGAMVTATSLVYSMTLVALTLAAQSAGQRLLQEFMGHRTMQVSLGLFLATFVYCLIVLRTIVGGDHPAIPNLSVAGAIVLALASLIWLIYFIHSLAADMQTHAIVARVAGRLRDALREEAREDGTPPIFHPPDGPASQIAMPAHGYLEGIDEPRLLTLAEREDLRIRVLVRPGRFICAGDVVAEAWGRKASERHVQQAVAEALIVGPRRTAADDAEYLVNLVVEIALRALSPGINDTYTAVACLDHLMGAFAPVIGCGLRGPGRGDERGVVRLELSPPALPDLLDAAFDPIRGAAGSNLPVVLRLLENLERLQRATHDAAVRQTIARQASLAAAVALRHIETESDRRDLLARLDRVTSS